MESRITYKRHGVVKTAQIKSRLIPNFLAVKFVVIEKELAEDGTLLSEKDPIFMEQLLVDMGLEIVDVLPLGIPEARKK